MKELLEFLRNHNGALYHDREHDCFVLCRGQTIKLNDFTVHCAFKGSDDTDIIPEKAGPELIEPAIRAIERLGS